MRLSKKIETEIEQFLQTYWDSYIQGDIAKWESFLLEDYKNIGTNQEEIWNNKSEILQYTQAVLDQMVGKAEIRNKKVQIIPYDPYIMTHELGDLYVKTDDGWTFYAPLRLSSLIQKQASGWVVLHQHGSFPDSKTQKGEAFAVDALKAENLKLQKAVQTRTFELVQKNRELQVESALERIRAQAVAMKTSSDLLDIVVTMRNEFIKLGHQAHYFWHMMWLPDKYEKAMTSGDGSKIGFVMELPRHIHGDIPLLAQWEKSKQPTVVYSMNVEEALDYVDKMIRLGDFQNIDPQAPTEDDIRHIDGLTFIMARTTHGEIGYSLPGEVENPPKEDMDILVKFAGAFDLAHRRFLDLQKTEKQARETEIELALEKVRSRTMAMQRSEELKEVIQVVYDQFVQLNIQIEHTRFIVDYKQEDMHIWLADRNKIPAEIKIPYFDSPHWNSFMEAKRNGDQCFTNLLDFNEKNKFYRDLFTHIPDLEDETKEYYFTCKGLAISTVLLDNVGLYIENFSGTPYSEEENKILLRFGKVFQQTYTRFLDLQRAEAQAREAEIELALERVRARTMAMQHSDELQEASFLLDEQVRALGIKTWGCAFNIYGENQSTEWFGNEAGVLPTYTVPRTGIFLEYYEKGQKGETLFVKEFSGKTCVDHYEHMSSLPVIGDVLKNLKKTNNGFPAHQIDHVVYFKYGYLLFITREHVPEVHDTFKRFAKVFEQTYTRFLDLQRAEAQAREAKIEAALEKIRARTMGMQNSEELPEVANLLFLEVQGLGVPAWSSGFNVLAEDKRSAEAWMSSEGTIQEPFRLRLWGEASFDEMGAFVKSKETFMVQELKGDALLEHYNHMKSFPDLQPIFAAIEQHGLSLPTHQINHLCKFSEGFLLFITYDQVPEVHDIFKRFAAVFDQTYTRFLDLQKAEAQAREGQIEAALERVRSQSMGMQTSRDLSSVTTAMFEQLRLLGGDLFATGIVFCDKHEGFVEQWHSLPNAGMLSPFKVPIDLDYIHQYRYDQWKKGTELFSVEIPSDFIEQHFQDIFELPSAQKVLKDFEDQNTPMPQAPPWEIDYGAYFKQGYLLVSSLQHFKEAEILPRFAKVFEQSYTRFLDLQKAEAQAREAQIEVALERVRASAMSMQSSTDVGKTVIALFEELGNLVRDKSLRCGIGILEGFDKMETWVATLNSEEQVDLKMGMLDMTVHPLLKGVKNAWKTKKSGFKYHLIGQDVIDYFTALNHEPDYPVFVNLDSLPNKVFHNSFLFGEGVLFAFTHQPLADEAINILKRFTLVFEHTYTRFLDLQKAEAQVKETIKQASLDRVRGEIASMRSAHDLERITPIIWNELIALSVPFIRCGVFIIQEEEENVQVYLSSPNGQSLGVLSLKMGSSELTDQTVENWRKGQIYKHHWNKEEFIAWTQSLVEQGKVQNFKTYQGSESPPETLDLNFVPFKQGMLYVGNVKPLTEEEINLVSALANTFSIAYARYEDFSQLEKAKKSIEFTLAELKAAQSQLIQSEKMASLGELTAGIAHEIQNPLNFVNNFSEVSKELIEELYEERTRQKEERDESLEDEILADIHQNLDKINHHGQRASAIVKGMLQHSRSSEGKKEPTDINALADEYLRLAYHGLRAKDKSFNADFKTDFDTSIPKIEVVPQDLGRILLNLINNAFYAVNEKAKTGMEGYKPEVLVSTRSTGNEVEISVKDNGPGIPDPIKAKIFQPFFTTKPTGSGTGLGLSLSYDIVKAHGGEIKLESTVGKGEDGIEAGTIFSIHLPI